MRKRTDDALAALDGLSAALAEMREAMVALVERVEMDESVGICLSSRVESLNAQATLAKIGAGGDDIPNLSADTSPAPVVTNDLAGDS